jgi:hypothetical protein
MCDVAGLNFGCGYRKRADVVDVVVAALCGLTRLKNSTKGRRAEAFTELEIACPKIHLRKRHTAKLVKRG